jgi:hypothetical protein
VLFVVVERLKGLRAKKPSDEARGAKKPPVHATATH